MGRDVLFSDAYEGVRAPGVRVVGLHRSEGPGRRVQRSRLISVVDGEDETTGQ